MSICLDSIRIANSTVIDLHEGRTPQELAPALFKFMAEVFPQNLFFLMLRPLEFDMRSFSSRPEFQKICDNYILSDHRDDIWLQRSPVKPHIAVVRHSLYTTQALLHRSRFYSKVLKRIGCEYGASLVAWRRKTWLGNLTILRSEAQGDFRDDELKALKFCHLHFQAAIKRIASFQEEKLASQTLAALIWHLPTAAIVLDWNLKLLFWNASSQERVAEWKRGIRQAAVKRPRRFLVPGEIVAAIERRRPTLVEDRSTHPKSANLVPLFQVSHLQLAEFTANVSFFRSKSLAVSKGTFVVVFQRRQVIPDERDRYDRMAGLTPREREVALLAAAGKNSRQIGKDLGTSAVTVRKQLHHVYKKLGINSRLELMAMFAKDPISGVPPALTPNQSPPFSTPPGGAA